MPSKEDIKMKIDELSEHFFLITDSCQVSEIRDSVQIDMQGCDSLFVGLEKDSSNYEVIYGFEGIVPLLDKTLTLLFPGQSGRF
jgi:hypothetical protein